MKRVFSVCLLVLSGLLWPSLSMAQTMDFGDAPDTYGTLLASNGARHTIGGPRLGATVDAESEGFDSFAAVGDDLDGIDDEDGIVFITPLIKDPSSSTSRVAVTVNQITFLDAWMDMNKDGDFSDGSEQIFTSQLLSSGVNILSFTLPSTVSLGKAVFRFRVSSAGGLSYDSAAVDGEVEDYAKNVIALGGAVSIHAPDGLADPLTIDRVGADLRIRASDMTELFTMTVSSSPSVTIEGTDGDDHFVLDLAGGFPMPASVFLVKGGNEGVGGDALTIKNATVTDVEHMFSSEQSGSIEIDTETPISYSGLEPIFDLVTATNKTFTFGALSETIMLEDDGDVADGESFVDSNLGGESVTFTHPTSKITVNAGQGTNIIRVRQIDDSYSGDIVINGGTEDDYLHADWTDGNPLLNGLLFDSMSDGASGDSVIVENGTVPEVELVYNAAYNGIMVIDGGVLTYTTVLPVRDELTSATKVINLRPTDDGGTFGDDIYNANNRSKLTVDSGGDTYTFVDPTSSVTLNGGIDSDELVLTKMDGLTNLPVIINGNAGDDTFKIDFVNGNPLTTAGITFNGGSQFTGGDNLILENGSGDLSTYVYANANDGTITVDGGLATYTGLEPIVDHLSIKERVFTFSAVDDIATLGDDGVSGDGYSKLETIPPTSETTTFLNADSLMIINLGDGEDDIHIKNMDYLAGPDSLIVYGQDGDDDFLVRPDSTYVVHVDGGDPTSSPGDTFEFDLSLLTGKLLTYFDLPPDAGYWWVTPGYENVSFKDVEYVPYKFFLLTPIHTITGVSQLPTFTWDYGTDTFAKIADIYVEADPDTTFDSSLHLLKDELDSALKTIDFDWDEDGLKLIANTVYYWRAVANIGGDNAGEGNGLTGYRHRIQSIADFTAELDYPHDGLATQDETFEFRFNVGHELHTATYLVEVDGPIFDPTDGLDVGSIVVSDERFDVSDLPSDIYAGGTYTWRIKTFIGSAVAGISDIATFSILGGVIVPTLSYPIDDLWVYQNEIDFSWYPSAPFGDLRFDLEYINTSAGEVFTGTPDVSDIEGLSQSEDLLPGKAYSWRVRTTHVPSGLVSAWSAAETFTTLGPGTARQPVLSWPIEGAEIHTTAPQLNWSVEGDATGLTYEIVWRPRGAFSDFEETSSDQSLVITGLGGGIIYEWKVRSVNTNGDKSAYSDLETFVVSTVLPASKAVTAAMGDDYVISTLLPSFKWYPDGDARQIADYELQWSTDLAFGDVAGHVTGLSESEYALSDAEILSAGTEYFWRVAARRTDGSVSDWTRADANGAFSTTTANGSLVPSPSGPKNVVLIETDRAVLNWQVHGRLDFVDDFEVQVSRESSFETVRSYHTRDFIQEVDDLERGALYHWRVRSKIGPFYSSYSAPRAFIVENSEGPVQPIPAGPASGEVLETRQPVLSWFTVGDPATPILYRLELSTNASFDDATMIEDIQTSFFKVPLLESGFYFWRVTAYSEGAHVSPVSETSTFSTAGFAVSSDDPINDTTSEIPLTTRLLQNYPNPFNPQTTIGFELPEPSNVRIRVYDVQGRLIRLLLDAQMPGGEHTVTWNARDELGNEVASGMYLYELSTPEFRATRQLVLIK